MPRQRKDLTGKRFGMLVALEPDHTNGQKWWWRYQCDCGAVCVKLGQDVTKDLSKGRTPNCGCMTSELIARGHRTHGMSKHPAYWVWRSMRDRCRLPTHQAWVNYGARGIRVCPEWNASFDAFWQAMGAGYRAGLEIDRIDNNGHYEPGNCHWVPCVRQANNRRGNQLIDTPVGRLTVSEASREFGVKVTTLLYRIDHGWPIERLFLPADFRNRESRSGIPLVKKIKRTG